MVRTRKSSNLLQVIALIRRISCNGYELEYFWYWSKYNKKNIADVTKDCLYLNLDHLNKEKRPSNGYLKTRGFSFTAVNLASRKLSLKIFQSDRFWVNYSLVSFEPVDCGLPQTKMLHLVKCRNKYYDMKINRWTWLAKRKERSPVWSFCNLLHTVTVKQNTSCTVYCKAYDLVHGWEHHQMKIWETFKFALFQIYMTQIN